MAGLFSCLLFGVQRLLDCWSGSDLLVPRMACWILLLPIESFVHGQPSHNAEPWYKHQIRITGFAADQILIPSLLQMSFDDANYTLDLVAIAVFRRLDLFVFMELWSLCQVFALYWRMRRRTNVNHAFCPK